MSILEYIQRARHLISCITTHPADMATPVHVFVSGMNTGYQRFYLTRKSPSTLEESFAVALREDYSVAASQAFAFSRAPVPEPEPEPMEIDAIRHFDRSRSTTCPALPDAQPTSDEMLPLSQARTPRGGVPRVGICPGKRHGGRPIRALLDFVRADSLSVLPPTTRISEGPGHMVVEYADGKPRRMPRRSVAFVYAFDGFSSSDDFLVIELSGSFDCVFGIPWLVRHQPHTEWLTRTVRLRDIDVNAVLAYQSGTPNLWPHVAVINPDSMTTTALEESDGPSYAASAPATCAGSESEPQGVSDVVEMSLPHLGEQELLPREAIERELLPAAEQGFRAQSSWSSLYL
ncbi:hypothetical protein PInf_012389 [Phytophthora infestans]|nr:hypothetical protein PInf_012389 [Phytophthora infestans]